MLKAMKMLVANREKSVPLALIGPQEHVAMVSCLSQRVRENQVRVCSCPEVLYIQMSNKQCTSCDKVCSNPTVLQCLHPYCQECKKYVEISQSCPECRPTRPSSASVLKQMSQDEAAFNRPRSASRLKQNVCQEEAAFNGSGVEDSIVEVSFGCSEHENGEIELYCKTCDEPICLRCAIRGGKHYSHKYEELNKASRKIKKRLIKKSLKPVESQLLTAAEALDQIVERCKDISDRVEIVEAFIEKIFDRCEDELRARKEDLIAQLHQMTLGKLRTLEAQREKLDTTHGELDTSVGSIRKSLSGCDRQVLVSRTTIRKVSAHANMQSSSVLQPGMLKPVTESDMTFVYDTDFFGQCRKFGNVLAVTSPDPNKCFITTKSLEAVVSSSLEVGNVILQVMDYHGKLCKNEIKSADVELVCELSNETAKCDVEKSKKQGQYKITYQPFSKGKHFLHVKLEGRHVHGSPYTVIVRSPINELGVPCLTLRGLKSPRGITINQKQKGEIVIAEVDGSCISIYTPRGEKITSFGRSGSEEGQLNSPRGVAVDDVGNIIVADSNNQRIQKFSSRGEFLAVSKASSLYATGLLLSSFPSGVAFNPKNKKIYMVDINHCVHIFEADLSLFSVFGQKGVDNGQLMTPWNIACDINGNVYVTDTGNHRIQVFTAEGKYLRKFGTQGTKEGELSWPDGIAVHEEMVYVSEYRNHRISVFTSEGQFVHSFSGKGENSGELMDPFGLTVDSSGLVYVCDSGNNRVQVF